MPNIAAIICTHNRDQYLGAAIDSLLNQNIDDYEILVIDNGSTDNTRQVVESRLTKSKQSEEARSFDGGVPSTNSHLKYIYEPELGLSVARNRGAQEANSPILAYLDDDAEASTQWLQVISKAFEDNDKLAIAGGKVTLLLPPGQSLPNWISESMTGSLGAYDLGEEVVYIENPNLTPRGLNYAIRQTFLNEVGGFDPNLGRVGKNLLSNEELLMTELALKKKWQVAYLPQALAAHNVAPERLKPGWFIRRSWWQGVSEYYREALAGNTGISQLNRGGERIIRGLYKSVKYINNPALCFDNLIYAYGQLGYLKAILTNTISQQKPR